MKNMKIKVETDEHGKSNIDEIVATLESNGYNSNCVCFGCDSEIKTVTTSRQTKSYEKSTVGNIGVLPQILTTLAELRSMSIETLKEMWDGNY